MSDEHRVDGWLERALNRDDAPVPDVRSVHRLCWCPASGALPGGLDPDHTSVSDLIQLARTVDDLDVLSSMAYGAGLDDAERELLLEVSARRDVLPSPDGAVGPARLAYMADRSVRLLPRDENGEYAPAQALVTCSVDLIWSSPPLRRVGAEVRASAGAPIKVAQYQLDAAGYVRPYWANAELAAATVIACRWTGAKLGQPATVVLGVGEPEVDEGPVANEHALLAFELQLREVLAQVEYQRYLFDRGEPVRLRTGPHCDRCPAAWGCPVMTAELKRMIDAPETLIEDPLDDDEAARLVLFLEMSGRLNRKAQNALRRYVKKHGNVQLDDGTWGRATTLRRMIDAVAGYEQLKDMVGSELANTALRMPSDGARRSLSAAIRRGAKLGTRRQALVAFYERLEKIGGLKPYTVVTYGRQRKLDEALQTETGPETTAEAKATEGGPQGPYSQGDAAPAPSGARKG